MIISAQFVASGFFEICCDWMLEKTESPTALLALTVAVCGALSAFLANDLVVFAMAPLLITGAQTRGLDPRPFLIALVGASNAGSSATLIGNPQNILIGQAGNLNFYSFLGRLPGAGAGGAGFGVRRGVVSVARPHRSGAEPGRHRYRRRRNAAPPA